MSVNKSVTLKEYNLTPRAKKAIKDAQKFAQDMGNKTVNNLHIFYGCIFNANGDLNKLLNRIYLTVDHIDMESLLDVAYEEFPEKFTLTESSDPWHPELTKALKKASDISNDFDHCYIAIEHLLLGILETSPYILEYLSEMGYDIKKNLSQLINLVSGEKVLEEHSISDDYENFNLHDLENIEELAKKEESIRELQKFGSNLNYLAAQGKIQPVYERENEISSLIEVLSKKNKSNAILIGEAGVGKTAIVEGLAMKIYNAEVPANILNFEIYNIDLTAMVSGTKYRGEFEQKFEKLMKIVKNNPHIVLFFDEIHNIFKAGGADNSMDASNILKPYLARGEVKCIGATTTEEYQSIFEKDAAMKRRFESIDIKEPNKSQTLKIVENSINSYEEFHNVKFSKPILKYAIDCCERFLAHKRFPDKAFDVIDQIGSKVKIKNLKPLDDLKNKHKNIINILKRDAVNIKKVEKLIKDYVQDLSSLHSEEKQNPTNIKISDVNLVISEHSKISLSEIESSSKNFDKFHKNIKKEVFGQDENLSKINDILCCSKIGLNEENKPLASFFFVGPTSVGKTYTAKKMAKYFYGNEKAFIQVNMSELQDSTGVSKLIGANAGYVGYEKGGFLTNFVRNNPNCVVLFDEVEKSNPKILNLLLHLLDEGYMMDNLNRKVDFSKTIVVLTSNIGHAESKKKSMGFLSEETPRNDSYRKSVKSQLKPELIARINEIIVFNDLDDNGLTKIIESEVCKFKDRLLDQGIQLKINKTLYKDLLEVLKSENIHAREIKDILKQKLIIPTAKFVVSNPKKSSISIKMLDKTINIQ